MLKNIVLNCVEFCFKKTYLFNMNEDMVRKIFSKLYPKLVVKSVEFLERQELNENGEWSQDSSSIFVGIGYAEEANFDSIRENGNITDTLTELTGFEFNVFIS